MERIRNPLARRLVVAVSVTAIFPIALLVLAFWRGCEAVRVGASNWCDDAGALFGAAGRAWRGEVPRTNREIERDYALSVDQRPGAQ